MASKGNANRTSLGDRMKIYEAVTTEINLVPNMPIYIRIDMRAGHSFCRGLNRPFDDDYSNAMKAATSYVVEKTNAMIGYCQSDEASFIWSESDKIPFETRLFKLQSVFASMFTSAFFNACLGTKLEARVKKVLPSFDCRACNLPSLDECVNMLLFRERDCLKNAITLVALEHFSNKQIHKKNGDEKIEMLKSIGVDFNNDIDEDFRYGAWFRRVVFQKELDADTIAKIPESKRILDENGKMLVTRSEVRQIKFGMPLSRIANKLAVILGDEQPREKVVDHAFESL